MLKALACVLAISLAACATASAPAGEPFSAGSDRTVRVEVANRNFYDATLYTVSSRGTLRIGAVGGLGSARLAFPWDFAEDVSFRIDLLSGPTCVTPPLPVNPGEVLGMEILPDFPTSALCL